MGYGQAAAGPGPGWQPRGLQPERIRPGGTGWRAWATGQQRAAAYARRGCMYTCAYGSAVAPLSTLTRKVSDGTLYHHHDMSTATAASGRRSRERILIADNSTSKATASPVKSEGKTVNVRANERMLFLLSQLKDEFGISTSESIRRGVSLFFIAKQEEKKGRKLAFIDENGNVAVEVHSL
jgi:hypothetical protein